MNGTPSAMALGPGAFRLILAGVVVYDHFTGVMLGRAAVYLFFVLSGYWIHRMWVERYSKAALPYPTFMASRLWRLLPMMLTATLLALAVNFAVLGRDPAEVFRDSPFHTLFSHLFFVGYSKLQSPRLLEPAWSLDLEMQFYLIAPLLVLLIARWGGWTIAALAVALTAASWLVPVAEPLRMIGWFAVGMAASAGVWRPSRRVVTLSLAVAVGLLAVTMLADSAMLVDRAQYNANTALNWVLAFTLIPFALHSCCVKGGQHDGTWGELSYAIYLIHWPVSVWLREALPDAGLLLVPILLLTLALSLLACRFIDRPLQRARSRWVAGRIDPDGLAEANPPPDSRPGATRPSRHPAPSRG